VSAPVENLVERLHAKRSGDGWKANCPAHEDLTPSLSIREGADGRALIKCHAGCQTNDILAAIDLKPRDLFVSGKNDSDPPKQRPSRKTNPINWPQCVHAFTEKHLERLSDWRDFPGEFCSWLHKQGLVGLYDDCIAFPVHENGKVVAAHFRLKNGNWNYAPTGTKTRPLVIGELVAGDPVHVFESQWDAFAFMSVSGERSGIIITRGASNGALVADLIPQAATVYLWTQNDKPGAGWEQEVCANTKESLKRCRIPAPHKDLNDWTRARATSDDLLQAMVRAETLRDTATYEIRGRSMVDYSREQIDESQNVLGNRWLERGHGVLVTGPSGIGKSTAVYQMTACWACGVVSFGINTPLAGGLRIVAVQTEDSHNDLIEMSRCVDRLGLSEAQIELVKRNTHIETINDAVGQNFIAKLDSFLEQKPRDLVILNPLSDFIPGELTDEKEVKYFLRQQLNPLLSQHHCGVLCVQPTPKTNRQDTEKYSWFDWMYWGAGSAEFARWARGGIVIVPNKEARGVYRFIAAKRFEKLGWLEPTYWFAHSTENDVGLWIPATQEQIAVCQKAKDHKPEDLHAVFPSEKELLRDDVRLLGKERLGMGQNKTDGFLTILVSHGWVEPHEYPRPKKRSEVRFLKNDNPSKPLR
jgi:hypothetical protein